VPYKDNGYWYYTRVEEGRIMLFTVMRKKLDATEEVIHNANQVGEGKPYYSKRGLK
jgi:oligopeptidase B